MAKDMVITAWHCTTFVGCDTNRKICVHKVPDVSYLKIKAFTGLNSIPDSYAEIDAMTGYHSMTNLWRYVHTGTRYDGVALLQVSPDFYISPAS